MAFEEEREPEAEAPLAPEGEYDDEHDELEAEELDEAEADTIRELEEAEEEELARAHAEYLRAVHYHFGDDAPILPCPTCATRGYVFAALADDPQAEQCPDCVGLGIVRTGSLVEGHITRPCTRCHGAGYVPRAGAVELSRLERPPIAATILPPEAFPPPPPPPVEPVAA